MDQVHTVLTETLPISKEPVPTQIILILVSFE